MTPQSMPSSPSTAGGQDHTLWLSCDGMEMTLWLSSTSTAGGCL